MKIYKNIDMFIEIDKKYIDPENCPIPFMIFTLGEALNQPAMDRPLGYEYHHMLWVEQGEGSFNVSGERYVLREGEGLFFKAGVPHSYKSTGGIFHTGWITFSCAQGILDYYKLDDCFTFKADALFKSQMAELGALCRTDSTVLSRSGAGYFWFTSWLEKNFQPAKTVGSSVRRFLENNYNRPITLDEVAEFVNMSKYSLCHYYKENFNCSVMEQLKKLRIEKAKQLLRTASFKTETVAKFCGFDSPSYFCKLFKEQTDMSPLEYKLSCTKKPE